MPGIDIAGGFLPLFVAEPDLMHCNLCGGGEGVAARSFRHIRRPRAAGASDVGCAPDSWRPRSDTVIESWSVLCGSSQCCVLSGRALVVPCRGRCHEGLPCTLPLAGLHVSHHGQVSSEGIALRAVITVRAVPLPPSTFSSYCSLVF